MPPDTITAESRSVIGSLVDVNRFALGVVGYRAVPSTGETLTLELSRRPDAVEAFTWLVRQGTPVARLYAYWALRTLAPDRAGMYAASLEADSTMIKTMSGCIVSSRKVGSIAIRLKKPDDVLGLPMPRP